MGLALLSSSIVSAKAQTQILGFIKNENGDAIPYATIKFKLDSTASSIFYGISTTQGFYTILTSKEIIKGYLEASAVGYKTKLVFVENLNVSDSKIDFILQHIEGALPEVFVKAESAIQISGDTISYKIDFFKRGNEDNVSKLISNLPGFVVQENGKISFNGEPVNKVLIENDDLTGKDYEKLIKTLSVTGIDKIQIIKNYTDPENITASISGSHQQVLNIKFKKKFLTNAFGTIEGNGGVPTKYYDANAQIVSLIQKTKFICFEGINNIGNTEIPIGENNSNQRDTKDESFEISLLDYPTLSAINDIKSSYTASNLISSNNSSLSSINYFFKPFKKIIIKGTTNFIRDRYEQNLTSLKQIFVFPQSINIHQFQNIRKDNSHFANSFSINYSIDKRNQAAFIFKSQNLSTQSTGNGRLQNKPYIESGEGTSNKYSSEILYNHLFKKNMAFTFSILNQINLIPNTYVLASNNYDSFFQKNTSDLFIKQEERQKYFYTSTEISLLEKYNAHSIKISLNGKRNYTKLYNKIVLSDTLLNVQAINEDSTNKFFLHEYEIGGRIQDVWTCNKALSLTIGGNLSFSNYVLQNTSGKFKLSEITGFKLFPNLSANLQLTKRSKLILSYNTQNSFPPLKDISSGYIINGLTSITKGYWSLNTAISHSAQLFFSHVNLEKKQLLFFSGVSFQQRPLLYLPNQIPNLFYTFSSFELTDKNINIYSFFSRADKFFSGMKSKISPQLNLILGNTYNIINYKRSRINYTQLKLGVDFSTEIKSVQIILKLNYSSLLQKSTNIYSQKIKTTQLENSTELSWKATSYIFLDFDIKSYVIYPPKQNALSLVLTNSRIIIHSRNNKWEWGIRCNNMLNQNTFSSTSISPSETTTTTYSLLPRNILGSFRYKF